jgi:group II intron reverse transcriptase/maturase
MRDAETILAIIHERGKQGKPLEDIYRQLYNPRLYLQAYDRLRNNAGAMTPGATEETIDGMSLEKIGTIIEAIRFERYRWTPVKRVYIPKKNGKVRPLGLPTWSDKLLQEVIRQLLEAYYEPQFSHRSHGFRPKRGCHTALTEVQRRWIGTTWFIEGDISQCFDRLDHEVLLTILAEKLHDNRFLRLIANMLKAGYLEDWNWHATKSGSPQGGVISPILSNIYLDRLDKFVEDTLLPRFNRGDKRKTSPRYQHLLDARRHAKKQGNVERYKALVQLQRTIPSRDTNDPEFRRLHYVRYADDFLLGFIGPRNEAQDIKGQLRVFLFEELKLEMSKEKTLITHARTERARFLGYEISTQHGDDQITDGTRHVNGKIALHIPSDVIKDATLNYMSRGKPVHRARLLHLSDLEIVAHYMSEYRGLVQYYLLAHNIHSLSLVTYVAETSLLKTLAAKHKTSVMAMVRKYKTTRDTPYGTYRCLRVVEERGAGKKPLMAEFGGIPLIREPKALLNDTPVLVHHNRTDLVQRLLADICERCGSRKKVQVHHVRKLADLRRRGRRELPEWAVEMLARRRKTWALCEDCHVDLHAGRPLPLHREEEVSGEPDAVKVARPVRRGADAKVP